MGWKMLMSYIMRPRDPGAGDRHGLAAIYDIFHQDSLDKDALDRTDKRAIAMTEVQSRWVCPPPSPVWV